MTDYLDSLIDEEDGAGAPDYLDSLIDDADAEAKVGPGEAALRGAAQGTTFGMSDEMAGWHVPSDRQREWQAEMQRYGSPTPVSEAEPRDALVGAQRARNAQALRDQPAAYIAGDVGGSIASMPLTGGTSLGALAAHGALQGAGRGEGAGRLTGAATGGAMGVGGGLAGRAVGRALGAGVRGVGRAAGRGARARVPPPPQPAAPPPAQGALPGLGAPAPAPLPAGPSETVGQAFRRGAAGAVRDVGHRDLLAAMGVLSGGGGGAGMIGAGAIKAGVYGVAEAAKSPAGQRAITSALARVAERSERFAPHIGNLLAGGTEAAAVGAADLAAQDPQFAALLGREMR